MVFAWHPTGAVTVRNSGTHAVKPTLYQKLPYDVIGDFTPVTQFSTTEVHDPYAQLGLVVVGICMRK